MDWKKLVCVATVAGTSLIGCGGDDGTNNTADSGVGGDGGGGAEMTYYYVMNSIAAAPFDETANVLGGFNLNNSTMGVCASNMDQADPNGPAPDNFTGVDNVFSTTLAPTISTLIGSTDDPTLGTLLTTTINDGSALILLEVSGVNDLTNDSSITVTGYVGAVPGGGAPTLSGGTLAAGQTFDISPASYEGTTPRIRFTGKIVNGRIDVDPATFFLTIPVGGANLELAVRETRMRATISASGLSLGILGGSLRTEDILSAFNDLKAENECRRMDPQPATCPGEPIEFIDSIDESTLSILSSFADLEPDGGGVCTALSVGVAFSGVSAAVGSNGL